MTILRGRSKLLILKTMAKRLTAIVVTLVTLLLFVVFPAHAREDVILQLKWVHAFQFAGYYAAKEKGFYDKAGLNVTIKPASTHTNVPESVLTGEAQYGVGTSSLLLERKQGKPVVALAVIFQHSPLVLVARETHSTQGVHDLVDKRVMIEPQSEELFAYLKRVGVPKDRLYIQKHSFNPDDLMQGRTDAISAYVTNERFFLEKANFSYHTYTPRSVGIDFYGDNLFTSEMEIENHPERVKAFREASLKGWQYAMDNPEELVDIILDKYPTEYSREFLLFEAQEMRDLLQPLLVEMGYMNAGRWQHIADTYSSLGMLPQNYSLEGFLYEEEGLVDIEWFYQVLSLTLITVIALGGLLIYIYSINRRLDSALADSRAAQDMIWNQANVDPLTDLPNRRMFKKSLQDLMMAFNGSDKELALLYLDLDHFKEINDFHGHGIGDRLLVDVAHRLQRCVGQGDFIARLGGDEFTVILPEPANHEAIETVARRILASLAQPYLIDLETLYVSVSIGITLYPSDSENVDELLKNADQAMYGAKALGRDRFHYFTNDMYQAALHRVQLVNDLRMALNEQQFELYYQPIVDLRNSSVLKAEALIRWNHPKRGLVSPLEFIPVAEEAGHILSIGDWVFKTATTQLSVWRKSISEEFGLSVNTSPEQYVHSEAMESWFSHMKSLGLDGDSVVIEITEGTLMESGDEVKDQLLAFRDKGVQVALDDFGTGYSSLSYLNKFDIDFIKIDKSFIDNLASGSNDLVLCEAMIVMAHKLGLKVIAEGVETEEQLAILKDADCDYAQGYLFSAPVSVTDFEALIASGKISGILED